MLQFLCGLLTLLFSAGLMAADTDSLKKKYEHGNAPTQEQLLGNWDWVLRADMRTETIHENSNGIKNDDGSVHHLFVEPADNALGFNGWSQDSGARGNDQELREVELSIVSFSFKVRPQRSAQQNVWFYNQCRLHDDNSQRMLCKISIEGRGWGQPARQVPVLYFGYKKRQ